MSAYVYALRDPRDGRARYVGSTTDVARRLRAHMAELNSDSPIGADVFTQLQTVIPTVAAFFEGVARIFAEGATAGAMAEIVAAEERRAAALRTFRRAMRRHERRARRMGLHVTARHIRALKWDPHPDHARDTRAMAGLLRENGKANGHMGPQIAFLFERAADAVAKLRSAT